MIAGRMPRAVAVGWLVLVACGGPSRPMPTRPPAVDKPAVEAACPPAGDFTLADGKLRCRELPFTVDFPPGTALKRQDDGNVSFIAATLDRGVLALFIEPRFDVDDDAAGLRTRLEAAIKGIAADAVIADAPAPPQDGATASSGLSFTTPDGGMGLVHGYLAHDWFVAVIAGGRLAQTPARPDQPAGKAFLASFKLRPLVTAWAPREVFAGVTLEMPTTAWETTPIQTTGSELATKLYAVANEHVWIGVRDLPASPSCAMFDGVGDADVPTLVKRMFGKDDLEVTGRRAKLGTAAMSAQLATPGGTMAMDLICVDPRVVLVTITGKRPAAELAAMLDHVTSRFKAP